MSWKLNRAGFFGSLALLLLFSLGIPTKSHAQYTNLHEFESLTDGQGLLSPVLAAGSTLYGTASRGGTSEAGTIWSFDTATNVFSKLHDFSSEDGQFPSGSLAISGQTIFGTANGGGGPDNSGTIWSYDTRANTFANLHNFIPTNGTNHNGLTLSGTKLIGSSQSGGVNNNGTLWSYDTTNSTFANLYDFSVDDSITPIGSLATSGDKVIGTTSGGGLNNNGTLWSLDTNSNSYSRLHDFDAALRSSSPQSVVLAGENIIGITSRGGLNRSGTLWSFDTSSNDLTHLHDFGSSGEARFPMGQLAVSGSQVLGTLQRGGLNGAGAVWSYDIASNGYSVLHEFGFVEDGAFPEGGVTVSGDTLFGTTSLTGETIDETLWSLVEQDPIGQGRVRWEVSEGGNGHWYEVFVAPQDTSRVPRPVSWSTANQHALASGGHLASITSEAENDFVFSLIDSPDYWSTKQTVQFGPWLGGVQAPDNQDPALGWSWSDGGPFRYTNWHSGEPNDFTTGGENRLVFFAIEAETGERSAFWNDEGEFSRNPIAFVVEYVPEPTSALLLVLSTLLCPLVRPMRATISS